MFLLDTDTIIFVLKGHSTATENLVRHRNDPMKVSVITLMELYYGAYKSQQITTNLAKIRTLSQSIGVVPMGIESVELFGMIKTQLEKKGTPLDDFDLAIASCAMAHNLTLVTSNTKHFQRVDGLKIADWTHAPGKD
ncbi:MAG: type II toxin-antitoxin system VapC family toxin [bacterium]